MGIMARRRIKDMKKKKASESQKITVSQKPDETEEKVIVKGEKKRIK